MLCSCLAMPYNARKYTVKQGTVLEARSAPRAKRRYALYSSCTLPSYLVLVVKISCVWIDFAKTEKHRRSGVCTQGHKSEERSTRTDKPPQRHQDRTTTGGQNTRPTRHSTTASPKPRTHGTRQPSNRNSKATAQPPPPRNRQQSQPETAKAQRGQHPHQQTPAAHRPPATNKHPPTGPPPPQASGSTVPRLITKTKYTNPPKNVYRHCKA